MHNCTIVNNSSGAAFGVGGIMNTVSGTLTMDNCIVSENTGSVPNISGSFSGTNNLVDLPDVKLAPLGDYGGPTPTMSPLADSPAIDAGSDIAATGITTDQRGGPRISGDHVDIGAVELQLITANTPVQIATSRRFADGSFRLGFASLSGASFRVFAATNIDLPLNYWTMIGFATETQANSGQFQFTDPQPTNYTKRFYRVRSP